jgi:hypothetical protein
MPEAGIQKSYRDYVRTTENMEREFAARGIRTQRLTVEIDQLIAWCRRNRYEIDGTGRAAYVAVLTMAQGNPEALDAPIEDNITRVVQ